MRHGKLLIILAGIILLTAVLLLVNAAANKKLNVSFYQLTVEKNIFDFRIVELADLHLNEFGADNCELVETIRNLKPDLIAMAGDMNLQQNKDYTPVLRLIESLKDIAPVYYSAGNHEYADILTNKNSTMIKDIEKAGAVFLDNTCEKVKIGSSTLYIGGICKNQDDVLKYKSTTKMLQTLTDKSEFRLLLSHYPEVFIENMGQYPVDLALCGHAHGGQVRLPFTDGLYSPDQGLFPKYTSGMRSLCGSTVIISRGLGNSHMGMRINNPPQLVVVDIN